MPKYYKISEAAAKRAKDMNSYSDYAPGSATAGYRAMVDEAYALAEKQKAQVDPMYHDKIDALVDRYDVKDGQRQYEWGHYGSDRAALEQDFTARVQEYQRLYNVDVRQVEAPGLYKYYSTQRPVDIGTFPKPPRNAPDEIVNYDQRVPVENGSFLAWGHLAYTRPLTKRQASDYELRPAPDNPDRPRSIREQMKNAARQAEADRGQAAPKKNAPDRGDR